MYSNKLDDIDNKYNSTYHRIIKAKMKKLGYKKLVKKNFH